VLALLGPNGAGKTTTIEILEGFRMRSAGEVSVLGHDPQSPGPDFRQRIGVVLQQSELWPNITVRETHKIFAGYYDRPRDVDDAAVTRGLGVVLGPIIVGVAVQAFHGTFPSTNGYAAMWPVIGIPVLATVLLLRTLEPRAEPAPAS
jgi:ABC-type Fe3+/spermidine/putrescine transport system ATPase subunit